MKDHAAEAERRLAHELALHYPDEAARLMQDAPVDESVELLESLPIGATAALLQRMTPATASEILLSLSETRAGAVLERLAPPLAASLLAGLDSDARDRLLGRVETRTSADLRELLAYPADTAGALMDPRVLAVHADTSVGQSLVKLRAFQDKRVRRLVVIDADRHPIGTVRLQELAMARPSETVESIMEPRPVAVSDTASREEIVETLTRSKLASLPVVDFEGRLVGVIRDDVLLAAAQQEATADIQSMVGASRAERALSPVSFAVRKRLPWLEINLATAFLAAAVVGVFESTIARFTALAVLLPVVAGQSGNTGAQALAVTMRGLALREIRIRQGLRVSIKELKVGFINGIAVAVTTSLAVLLWSRSIGLALVIAISMVLSMTAAGLSGAAIPLFLTAIKQDPAQSSSIILTTVTDVVGFFSFLGIATLLAEML